MWKQGNTTHRASSITNRLESKFWQVALSIMIIVLGALTSCNTPPPNIPKNPSQNVFVFVAGMNTTINDKCQAGTFDDLINNYIVKKLGASNPYAQGCNAGGQSYLDANSSIAFFSYNGGHMDAQHGSWLPNVYNGCDADNHRIADDVTTFENMLISYEQIYPKATFTIVGHSLGGLIGLQGAYDYTKRLGHKSISKVITIVSPLEGLFAEPQKQGWINWASAHCTNLKPASGWVVPSDLIPFGQVSYVSPLCTSTQGLPYIKPPLTLSQCAARALTNLGVGVYTLGNSQDSLFCNATWKTLIVVKLFEGRAAASPYLSSRGKAAPTGLHKDENTCYTVVYRCTIDQTRHLQAGLPLCLVSYISKIHPHWHVG